jgi:hypothetical protein
MAPRNGVKDGQKLSLPPMLSSVRKWVLEALEPEPEAIHANSRASVEPGLVFARNDSLILLRKASLVVD